MSLVWAERREEKSLGEWAFHLPECSHPFVAIGEILCLERSPFLGREIMHYALLLLHTFIAEVHALSFIIFSSIIFPGHFRMFCERYEFR